MPQQYSEYINNYYAKQYIMQKLNPPSFKYAPVDMSNKGIRWMNVERQEYTGKTSDPVLAWRIVWPFLVAGVLLIAFAAFIYSIF